MWNNLKRIKNIYQGITSGASIKSENLEDTNTSERLLLLANLANKKGIKILKT